MDIQIGDLLYHPRYECYGIVVSIFINHYQNPSKWWNVEWYNIHGKIAVFTEHHSSVLVYKNLLQEDKKWLKEIKVVFE